ncbi:lytic polysaccharide monooxygenase auxiliary activity family 9 protein [Streptomyces alkaliterrae]|uniref:LPXTG cell wall anchor domain-containing protein n=1 Tax=Streptomyces alkaliterrae TaxID=2213162 RepID=A0A5P0YQA6_9ACTN|nr:lytic polysaccharide monooxygenase [Streptomyces alkaliterrae]MBB1253508.1 lytic polysaccharide monooxygenase [Streptomyces alkaliterrae]MBB1258037.1 lytic polysaccharide monooxygenase [Streptomyces alkaliterrae]MQS01807.1 LPXTG cell wall anchor domain-containing protein [Streptomyces alkaliterrae]
MTARRTVAAAITLGVAPLALTGLTATPAAAHGSMTDPVSRVAACYAEGPESPETAACKAAIAASGTQAFYDWNEVNIGDAAGRHREIIPDGKLCSAGRDKYKGLDLPRADWPASPLTAGEHTFRYKATAPHAGSIALYLTKDGYDPTKPLTWADLEDKPFAEVTDPTLRDGDYVFNGTVPGKSGRHLVYSIWQRSDSPEAFYTCSDVVFGGDGQAAKPGTRPGGGTDADAGGEDGERQPAPQPSASLPAAPTDEQIESGREKSTVSHDGHGGDTDKEHEGHKSHGGSESDESGEGGEKPAPKRDTEPMGGKDSPDLAATGGDDNTTAIAAGGAAVLIAGAALTVATTRRRRTARHRG